MNPDDLKKILDALTTADVREFALRTGSFDLSLKRGPQFVASAQPTLQPSAAPSAQQLPQPVQAAPLAQPVVAAPSSPAALVNPVAAEVVAPPEQTGEVQPQASGKGQAVKAPIVGTFYASSTPDAPAYVKVGDRIEAGQVLCIIEAMKLMNEIEAEVSGTVREILVSNAEPVEYGQTLFIIE